MENNVDILKMPRARPPVRKLLKTCIVSSLMFYALGTTQPAFTYPQHQKDKAEIILARLERYNRMKPHNAKKEYVVYVDQQISEPVSDSNENEKKLPILPIAGGISIIGIIAGIWVFLRKKNKERKLMRYRREIALKSIQDNTVLTEKLKAESNKDGEQMPASQNSGMNKPSQDGRRTKLSGIETEVQKKTITDTKVHQIEGDAMRKKVDEQFQKDVEYYRAKLDEILDKYETAKTQEELIEIMKEEIRIGKEMKSKYTDLRLHDALKRELMSLRKYGNEASARVDPSNADFYTGERW